MAGTSTEPPVLPFEIRRGSDTFADGEMTSTSETIHGLLRLEREHLVVQWRVHRATDRFGREIRTDQEVEPVRQVSIPLAALAGAVVRRPWWRFGSSTLVLRARDLGAFEEFAGPAGLGLDHPSELVLSIRRRDLPASRDFAAETALAVADRALRLAGGAGAG